MQANRTTHQGLVQVGICFGHAVGSGVEVEREEGEGGEAEVVYGLAIAQGAHATSGLRAADGGMVGPGEAGEHGEESMRHIHRQINTHSVSSSAQQEARRSADGEGVTSAMVAIRDLRPTQKDIDLTRFIILQKGETRCHHAGVGRGAACARKIGGLVHTNCLLPHPSSSLSPSPPPPSLSLSRARSVRRASWGLEDPPHYPVSCGYCLRVCLLVCVRVDPVLVAVL